MRIGNLTCSVWRNTGPRLHRDPSIISRLYAAYAAECDWNKEMVVAKQLER
jgi:hypothetical protein